MGLALFRLHSEVKQESHLTGMDASDYIEELMANS